MFHRRRNVKRVVEEIDGFVARRRFTFASKSVVCCSKLILDVLSPRPRCKPPFYMHADITDRQAGHCRSVFHY